VAGELITWVWIRRRLLCSISTPPTPSAPTHTILRVHWRAQSSTTLLSPQKINRS